MASEFLLTESALGAVADDLLEHRALAQALTEAILAVPTGDTLGVALYGSWGQGKSTIGGLVREQLKDHRKIAFVPIGTWRFVYRGEPAPLRRHYLLQAYEAIGQGTKADALRQSFGHVVTRKRPALSFGSFGKLRTLAEDRWIPIRVHAYLARRRIRRFTHSQWFPLLTLTAIILAVSTSLRHFFHSVIWNAISTAFLLSGAVLFLFTLLARSLADGLMITTTNDPFDSVESFSHQFAQFITHDARAYDKFVFFIDDLDRCDDELVVEALATLQAFFGAPNCIYIVAADEKQLKRAVRAKQVGPATPLIEGAGIPPDETFLEKIFHVSLFVPPLYPETMSAYAKTVAASTRIAAVCGTETERVLSYLVHPDVASPRQTRTIINDFLLTAEQIHQRAQVDTGLNASPLMNDTALVAKLVVIRSHFPWAFELLRGTPHLLFEWHEWANQDPDMDISGLRAAATGAAGETMSFVHQDEDERHYPVADIDKQTIRAADSLLAALRGFLIRTRSSVALDAGVVHEFVYLRAREAAGGLFGTAGQAYRVAIANGDERALADAVRRWPELRLPAVKHAIDRTSSGFGVESERAVTALDFLVQQLSDAELEVVGASASAALFGDT